MKLNWINRQNSPARSIALGTFDGVHLGHQKLLEETVTRKPHGGTSCVFTFDIPPEQYFRGSLRLVSSFEQRIELFRSFGIDEVTWLNFGPELSSMDAQTFVEDILVKELRAKEVICGYDFRFGSGRGGDTQFLREQGEKYGFSVTIVPPVHGKNGQTISSTAIRKLLGEGNLTEAAECLGYYPRYLAKVESEGSSTLSLSIDPSLVIPGDGIYLVWCLLNERLGAPGIAWRSSATQYIELVFLEANTALTSDVLELQFLDKLRDGGPYQMNESDVTRAQQMLPRFHLQDAKVVLK